MCRHRLRTTFHRRTSPRAFRPPCRRRSRRTPRCRSPKRDRWLALVNKGWIPSWDEGRPDAKDDVDGNPSGSARVGLGSGVAAGRRPLRPDPSGDRRTALMPEGSVARRSDPGHQRTPCTEAAAQARGFALGPINHPALAVPVLLFCLCRDHNVGYNTGERAENSSALSGYPL